jgi:hypothetical protein
MPVKMKDCRYIIHVSDSEVTFCENGDAAMVHLATLNYDKLKACTIFSQISSADALDIKNASLRLQG